MTTKVDPLKRLNEELAWLKQNPAFEERPATLEEFLGPQYLNIADGVRARIREELVKIMGDKVRGDRITQYPLAMITGGIGIGKTTIASIVLPYLVHWVLCLKDPQSFFSLLPGSRIAFMQMSTSEKQALEVVFGDIKARVEHSPWFRNKYPMDSKFTNQIRFPKDVWILPGDSAETTFEGYNILGGILDEADSHKVTPNKDYAEMGYTTISARIESRFGIATAKGFLLVIGQMKSANGFAARKYREFLNRDDAYAVSLAIWESFGWDKYLNKDGTRDSFWYDKFRKEIVPTGVVSLLENDNLIEIPNAYKREFENNPEKALRDLAGIPPAVGDPFISLTHKIHSARDRWIINHDAGEPDMKLRNPYAGMSPVRPDGTFEDWFICRETIKRVVHVDIAYSANGDGLGIAMGHVDRVVEIDGEVKPYIVIDMLMRMSAPAGGEIFLSEMRHVIYHLRDDRKFRITKATMDGFQSQDTIQQFQRRRIESEQVSVDKQVLPYHDLREAIYEERIEFPPYMVLMRRGDAELTEVAVKELTELVDAGNKIDHPDGGSKDVADALAGVTFTLMGDRTFRRKIVDFGSYRQEKQQQAAYGGIQHPAVVGGSGMSAPLPPSIPMFGARR